MAISKKEKYSVKQQIADTFVTLIAQNPYMDITVTELIQTANVARVSFYRNFSSISDVFDYVVNDISDELIRDVFPVLAGNDAQAWRTFLFSYFYRFMKSQNEMETLRCENLSVLLSRLNLKMQQYERGLSGETMRGKYAAFGKMGLINNMALRWIGEGMKETPEEMVDYIMSFILLF